MSRRSRALVLFVVTLVVIAVCGISLASSLASAAHHGTHVCDVGNGWGPTKTDSGSSVPLLLDLAAIPVSIAGPVAQVPAWAAPPERPDPVVRRVLAEPRVPRAPPIS